MDVHGLVWQRCVACRPGEPAVSADELRAFLAGYPEWKMIEPGGVPQLQRMYRFKSYLAGLEFISRVAQLAEAEDHHPTLLLEWRKVTVTWWTHAIHNLHKNDLIMAAKSDQVYGDIHTPSQ
jgi:4a-hydroxytetrahydrobiopterin dehydratase